MVEDAVNRKIRNHCYPIIQGEPGSYEQSWGFNSLLGAMWLQMLVIMRADRKCRWCNKALDPSMRSHAKFCRNNGKCKGAWHGYQKEQRRRRSRGGGAT
jgi:hypothetical protein